MEIVPVESPEQVAEVTALMTLAFADDPVTRWLFPSPARHLDAFGRVVHAFSRDAFENGTARLTADGVAAAVWVAPGAGIDEAAMGAVLTDDVPEELRGDAETFFGELDERYHPHHEHWYLPLLGVESATARGKGYGSALLTEGLQRCDADHLEAYLESTNERNIPLYRRFGFEVMGTVQVGAGPPMTPMLRPAR